MSTSDKSSNIRIMVTSQVHVCGKTTEKQINSVSQSLSASANFLRKLVEGGTQKSVSVETTPAEVSKGTRSTISFHAETSFGNALIGFTQFDSGSIDTDTYKSKRQAYEVIRQKYPNMDDLPRDEKVQALRELKSVGFRYHTIQVTAFVKKDGLTRTVSSKKHHRLESPPLEYLKSILTEQFKGSLILKQEETAKDHTVENAVDGSTDV